MLHKNRRWVLFAVPTAEDLARKLTEMTWCGCNGFTVAGTDYLFLNDATSGDRAQEYAVVKRIGADIIVHEGGVSTALQVESITFSWCTYERALDLIRHVLAGEYDHADYAVPVTLRLDTREQHGRCAHCA